jgi:hypothetical protein
MGVESISTFDSDTLLTSAWLETYTQHTDFLPAAQQINFLSRNLKTQVDSGSVHYRFHSSQTSLHS